MPTCPHCHSEFKITDQDREFLEKVSPIFSNQKQQIPAPTLCSDCRKQRRMTWRNERKMYHRNCDHCQKKIIAMYRPETPFPVYCLDCWWGDSWDRYAHGQDFDFSRPFFEQFFELRDKTPHFSLAVLRSTMENSDFCNHAGYLKNCYLCVNLDEAENCLYGKGMNRCFDCMDSYKIYDCEACYECLNCNNCKFSTYLIDCHTSSYCHFSANLTGCQNCFGCVNLHNKQFYFFNQKLTEDEYNQKVTALRSQKTNSQIQQEFLQFRSTQPQKWMSEKNTESVTGDYLVQSKNSQECYDCEFIENCHYCNDLKKGDKVSFENQDISYFGMGIDASYECSVGGYNANHTLFCENVWDCSDIYYSQICLQGSSNLFGCIGINHGHHAILNKRYSPEEFEQLVPKIIDHMRKTGEWGEFFPSKYSAFGYNETSAQEYFPLTKSQALSQDFNWYDEKDPDYSNVTRTIEAEKLPDFPGKIPDEILNWAIKCQATGRLFKIQKMELDFYLRHSLPVPKFHPDERHRLRFQLKNPQKLYARNCDSCQAPIQTSFAPTRPEQVFCHKCYLQAID